MGNSEKKRRLFAIFIKTLMFFALIGVSAAVIMPIQKVLSAEMTNIRDNLIAKAESLTGFQIKYSSIRPTIFGFFDIRNLKLLKNGNTFISAERVRISFSFLELIKKKTAAIHTVQLDRLDFYIDLEKDKDIFEKLDSISNQSLGYKEVLQELSAFFPEQPVFRIKNSFINISEEEKQYLINNINIDITGKNEKLVLSGKLDARIINVKVINKIYNINTAIDITGECSADFENASAQITFSPVNFSEMENLQKTAEKEKSLFGFLPKKEYPTAAFDIMPGVFQFTFNDGIVSLSTLNETLKPGVNSGAGSLAGSLAGSNTANSAFFNYNAKGSVLFAAVNCADFPLNKIVKFSKGGSRLEQLLSLRVTGSSSFQYEKNGSMQYIVDFKGAGREMPNLNTQDNFEVRAHGSEKQIVAENVRFYSDSQNGFNSVFNGKITAEGTIRFYPLAPQGVLVFENFNLGTEQDAQNSLNAVFSAETLQNEILISSEAVKMAETIINDVNISFYPGEEDIGVFLSGFGEDESSIELSGNFYYNPRRLDAFLSLNSFSSISLAQMTMPFTDILKIPPPVQGFIQDSFITTSIFFATDFEQISYNAPNLEIAAGGTKGVFSFSGTDENFILSESVITADGKDFYISAQTSFSNADDIGFSLFANYDDFAWRIEGQLLDKTTLIIRDPGGLNVYGSMSNSGAVSGYFEGKDFPIPVNGNTVYFNFYFSLRLTSKDFWSISIDHFTAYDNPVSLGRRFFNVTGALDQNGASFKNFILSDNIGELAGNADFTWESDFSYIQYIVNLTDGLAVNEIQAGDSFARENYFAEGIYSNNYFNTRLAFNNVRLDRFLNKKNKSGQVLLNASADISYTSLESFTAQLNLISLQANLNENPVQASGMVLFNENSLTVSDLKFNYMDFQVVLSQLNLNLLRGTLQAEADMYGSVKEKKLEGGIAFNADFEQVDSWTRIGQVLKFVNGSLKVENIFYGDQEPASFAFIFENDNGDFSVKGGPDDMLLLDMDKNGNFFASVSSPFPIQSTFTGSFADGIIDAHCPDFYMDLSSFWSFLPPLNGFGINGGYVTGKVDIKGDITNPQFFGLGRGTNVSFTVPDYIPEDIKPVTFDAVFEGSDMIFGPLNVSVGQGGGTAEGWLRFDNWVPRTVGLEINIPRNTPIPYTLNVTGFLAEGDASGILNLNIENQLMELTGDLYADNTELSLNIEDITQARNQTDEMPELQVAAIINMTITTGPIAEFIWPNTNMPILRANAEMGTVVEIFADTETSQFSLDGDVAIRSGELFYFDRSFYIRQGNLIFNETEQDFQPTLSAVAEIRDRTDTGPVTISMIIENQPLLNFSPRFEARPSMTQLEIYSLLGHNQYALDGTENADTAQRVILSSAADVFTQVLSSSDFFNQYLSQRRAERWVRNFLHVDMFSLRIRLLQNAAANAISLGSGTASSGESPANREIRVGNYFDNTSVYMGKYVGQSMFVQGMFSLRYDENGDGYGGVKFEPDIGIELQSPLFNIRWDFFPEHPENWWVNDNSITLLWSRSF